MQDKTVNTLGINYVIQTPSSSEEYNGLAPARENPVLEDAVDNVWYRGGAAKARDVLYDGILKAKGMTRPTQDGTSKNEDGSFKQVNVPATRANINALLDEDESLDAYTSILEEWGAGFKFDPSAAERSSGGGAITITKAVKLAVAKLTEALGLDGAAAKLAEVSGEPVEATEDGLQAAFGKLDRKRIAARKAAEEAAKAELNAALGM